MACSTPSSIQSRRSRARARRARSLRVLLDPLDLRGRLGVAAELERDQQLVEPPAAPGSVMRAAASSGPSGTRGQVEVGALPEVRDDRTQHGELLVGRAAVDVDRAQRAR